MSKLDDIIARHNHESDQYDRKEAKRAMDDRDYLLELVKDLTIALQLIADQTICPDLFPKVDPESDELCVKTAIVIALSALGKVAA